MRTTIRLLTAAAAVLLPAAVRAEPVPYAAWDTQPPEVRALIVGAMFDGMTFIPHNDDIARFTKHWAKCVEERHLAVSDLADGVYALGHGSATYQHSRLFLVLTTWLGKECGPVPPEPL